MLARRFVAIDWSGAADERNQRARIWMADLQPRRNEPLRLFAGKTRAGVAAWLLEQNQAGLVVGLDFAFSFPEWFVREHGGEIRAFWGRVAVEGEAWLRGGKAPLFWGRGKGSFCPPELNRRCGRGLRATDRIEGSRIQPKSPFQIGGAGAVGTGSLRGVPMLLDLAQAGFRIWPFDEPNLANAALVLEIYPRVFTGDCHKSNAAVRAAELQRLQANLGHPDWLGELTMTAARESEDAFDALFSVLGMYRRAEQFGELQRATDPIELLEGRIWL